MAQMTYKTPKNEFVHEHGPYERSRAETLHARSHGPPDAYGRPRGPWGPMGPSMGGPPGQFTLVSWAVGVSLQNTGCDTDVACNQRPFRQNGDLAKEQGLDKFKT